MNLFQFKLCCFSTAEATSPEPRWSPWNLSNFYPNLMTWPTKQNDRERPIHCASIYGKHRRKITRNERENSIYRHASLRTNSHGKQACFSNLFIKRFCSCFPLRPSVKLVLVNPPWSAFFFWKQVQTKLTCASKTWLKVVFNQLALIAQLLEKISQKKIELRKWPIANDRFTNSRNRLQRISIHCYSS